MSVIRRAAIVLAGLSVATIPAAALSTDIDQGAETRVSGPARIAQLVPQNATIETDAAVKVPVEGSAGPRSLVPENPVISETAPEAAEPAAAPPPPAEKPKRHVKRKSKSQQAKGAAPGSWELLFQGPSKK